MTTPLPPYLLYLAAAIISVVISLYAVRKIIFITRSRKIFDIPDNVRKFHGDQIASLGGIGIFAGYMVASAFFMYLEWYYVVAASVILFFTGVYDDIMNMRPSKKLIAQLVAASITVLLADIRITSLYGIGGIWELPYYASAVLTIIGGTFFINVFNFMDGIDGLACSLGILYTGITAALFAILGDQNMAGISLSLLGATAGLLYYNVAPARIYMGDTGSMVLGLTIFTLCTALLNLYGTGQNTHNVTLIHSSQGMMSIIVALMFLPVFDALRVFALRLKRGVSPFLADRTHIHYYLLDAGFSHTAAVIVIVFVNILLVALAWLTQDLSPLLTFAILAVTMSAVMLLIARKRASALRK
ncbi:MAG: undecaprenyl/decaprenyl-phosphate alpha-N-acetylglucosaminyl 1-phosphate transferase [Flavipsychrobacter sp.]|nr:undecaprenyl/decaprenyl-phosphate alpha-N-acetylglucosaminyl 1-phosphate transferase [Flavipsychrobacter sp.]